MDIHPQIEQIIISMREATRNFQKTAAAQLIDRVGRDPYQILVSCILSLRTKDAVSLAASLRLFEQAHTPAVMLTLSVEKIQSLIYPCGFYRTKARTIVTISHDLLKRFDGQVPRTMDELLSLHGVGRKTASLVLTHAFGIPALCVDTHVHRIANRLGLVATKTPAETEAALARVVPQKYWAQLTELLVIWGQNVCVPISPFCSTCPLAPLCKRVGVTRYR
jgi:endonuclease-3